MLQFQVGSQSGIRRLKDNQFMDEVIYLNTPINFKAVGQFYDSFPQVSDEEAIRYVRGTVKD